MGMINKFVATDKGLMIKDGNVISDPVKNR